MSDRTAFKELPVLPAMRAPGRAERVARATLRFSRGWHTNVEEYALEFEVDIRTAQRDFRLFRETFPNFQRSRAGDWRLILGPV